MKGIIVTNDEKLLETISMGFPEWLVVLSPIVKTVEFYPLPTSSVRE